MILRQGEYEQGTHADLYGGVLIDIQFTQVLMNLSADLPHWVASSSDLGILFFSMPVLTWLTDRFKRSRNEDPTSEEVLNLGSNDRELDLEREVERLRNLLRMTASLNSTLNLERVLEMTLDLASNALQDTPDVRLVSSLMLFSNDQLYVASARGLTQADMRAVFPAQQGVIGDALASVQTCITYNPAGDPELQRLIALHNCNAAVCFPLVVGLELYGMLLFAHTNDKYFTDNRLEVLEAIAQQAMVALQNARLYRALEQEKERIGEIQEDARRKLARDLHDGPTQSIGAIAMRVNFARRLLTRDPDSAAGELFKIEELARRTTKEIRQMLFTLRPLALESEGLIPALQQLAEKMKENHDQNVIIEAKEDVANDLEVGKQGVVFFIIEEAVNNARKHAKANHIWVRMKRKGDLLYLNVEDDGVGFNVAKVQSDYQKRGSLGMVNLHERAELVNGVLKIDSSKGKGTRIMVTIPMTIEASERLHSPGFVA